MFRVTWVECQLSIVKGKGSSALQYVSFLGFLQYLRIATHDSGIYVWCEHFGVSPSRLVANSGAHHWCHLVGGKQLLYSVKLPYHFGESGDRKSSLSPTVIVSRCFTFEDQF